MSSTHLHTTSEAVLLGGSSRVRAAVLLPAAPHSPPAENDNHILRVCRVTLLDVTTSRGE